MKKVVVGENYVRDKDDFFPTTADCIEAFIRDEGENIPREVWEPAAGDGAISSRLQDIGITVISTDLVDRGFCRGGVDFLMELRPLSNAIITNAPFKLQGQFIKKAIDLNVDYFAFFHRTTFINTDSWSDLMDERPASRLYSLNWRPDIFGIGSPNQSCLFMWTVWDRRDDGAMKYKTMRRPPCTP